MSTRSLDQLSFFKEKLKEFSAKDLVKDLEFSGSTYQVLVRDPYLDQEFWVFLQLSNEDMIKDSFCLCEESNGINPCLHLAVAYVYIFGKEEKKPLHRRFSQSLWNALCMLYEERLGNNPDAFFTKENMSLNYLSATGKKIFSLEPKNSISAETINRIIYHRKNETEENSLKFSDLTEEEIVSWRTGDPQPRLRYDLSFWSDLAKWFMNKQESGENYTLSFRYSKAGIPNWIQVDFEDISIGFYLSKTNLDLVVESLETIKNPLKVYHEADKGIEKIIYDKKDHLLKIIEKPKESRLNKKIPDEVSGIALGDWLFVPGDGFYAIGMHELLRHPSLYGENIVSALNEHGPFIAQLLEKEKITFEPTSLSYSLHFDHLQDLHIEAFLFQKGDLFSEHSWIIDSWAYIDGKGFYFVEDKVFEQLCFTIPSQKVSTFVTENRIWFNEQPGFETHIRSVDFEIGYEVTANNRLTFKKKMVKKKNNASFHDFGAWIYWKGSGFYSKREHTFSHLLNTGVSLKASQIPLFIKLNREELQLISNFFSPIHFIKAISLKIEYCGDQKALISPVCELIEGIDEKELKLFEDVAYVPRFGFYELPLELQLPEKFNHPIELKGKELYHFLKEEIESIQHYIKEIDSRLSFTVSCKLKLSFIQPIPQKGRGWYQFNGFYETEKGIIPLFTFFEAIANKQSYGFFEAGLVDLLDQKFDWLRLLKKERWDPVTQKILINSLEFMRLQAFTECEFQSDDEESFVIFEKLKELSPPKKPDLTGFKSVLRSYQVKGVDWLWFLYSEGLSGLLCDDMGLGKTHQTMGLLASVYNFIQANAEGAKRLFLIVCPTSVLYHWEEKLKEFLPEIKIYLFHGLGRSLEQVQDEYDLVLTSYGILRNEREAFSKLNFEIALFDEIQVAKNQYSLIYVALGLIKAEIKIGLTGTPIENRLRELKSLFDIVLPGYMPNEKVFKDLFVKPIEKEKNQGRQEQLSRLIRPFVMRRTKESVLNDLPEKIENISYCDLIGYQQELYDQVLMTRRHQLLEDLEDDRKAIPYLHIFSLLSSLKQICDHPALYLRQKEKYEEYSCGKWDLFKELLDEAHESNQKVVVFSQYLGMLDIMEEYLKNKGIRFASLRGATINRKRELQQFKENPDCQVFLGSLQAAGLGIDLTPASVVIHYDRWWNAARENQATDRVYRIGQTRGVQVFKLITKNTFEEKIHLMIERKKQLLNDIFLIDSQEDLKKFTRAELMEILS